MRTLLRFPVLGLLLALLCACEKHSVIDTPTQVLVRITSNDAALEGKLTQLKVSAAVREASGWRAPDVDVYAAAELKWPVEVPVFPRNAADANKQFEVVVDALRNDQVLARAHVITEFRAGRRLVLEVPLFWCPGHSEPFVCGDEGCRGEACTVCSASGTCVPVTVTNPDDLIEQRAREDGGQSDASVDASNMDAAPEVTMDDGSMQQLDATPEAQVDAAPADSYALGRGGESCTAAQEGTLACDGHASSTSLKCVQGTWTVAQTCAADRRCDSRAGTEQGTCAPVRAPCVGKQAGDVCDGTVRVTCGVDLVTSTNTPCASNQHCESVSGAAQCVCDTGFQSSGNEGCTNPNDCLTAGACNNGTCKDGLGTFTCDCNDGYTGTGTQQCTKVAYCPKDACAPGGTCVDVPAWSCNCGAGYTGTGTQACTNANDCPSNKCLAPNGTCEDLVAGYKCNCNTGFSGIDCENDVCAPNPCQHGGTCSRGTSGAVCACGASGYTGTLCQTDIDECSQANSCNNTEYPCAQTAAPGYTCLGHFADWHMPDATAGSKYAPSYDTNTSGIVRDLVTGLMWERAFDSRTHTWQGAKAYCNALGLGGFDDWRMPTKIELETLLDETKATSPTINTTAFPGTLSQTTYWSSSSNVEFGNGQSAWVLSLEIGLSTYYDTTATTTASVRCVRNTTPTVKGTPSSRYTVDAAADTVTDTRTNLIWQRTLSASTYTWDNAKSYCTSRGTGWRLPALKELLTLVDPTRVNPSIASVFPDTPGTEFWSASVSATDSTYAWWVTMYNGYTDGYLKTSPERVRCVR